MKLTSPKFIYPPLPKFAETILWWANRVVPLCVIAAILYAAWHVAR